MPPLVALAIDSDSPPLKPLEQVLRDRHAHVFVLRADDPLADIDDAGPDLVVITSLEGAELVDPIRARFGEAAPRIVAVFPECDEAPEGRFDERLAEALCSRTLARLIDRGDLRESSPPGPSSGGAARS